MSHSTVDSLVQASDVAATRTAYTHFTESRCDCSYCRNFRGQPCLMTRALVELLERMGVDAAKPLEIIEFGRDGGVGRHYMVHWPFVGASSAPPGDADVTCDGRSVLVRAGGIPCPEFNHTSAQGEVSIEFKHVPWVLDEPEPA
jgi:hypothetical protein